MSNPSSSDSAMLTVWYDGGCPLCVREIALMRKLDRDDNIAFVNLERQAACPLDRELMLSRFHAQEQGMPVVSGAEAFAAMWRSLPLMRPLGWAARWRPLLLSLEWLYLRFLKFRPQLQRLVSS